MELSNIGKDLYNRLNKDSNGYHPLEKYIHAIDQNLDNSNGLRSIRERIGIFVNEREDVPVIMYYKLKEYLDNEKDPREIQRIMNMSPDQYNKYLVKLHSGNIKLDRNAFYPLYSDRLYLSIQPK